MYALNFTTEITDYRPAPKIYYIYTKVKPS
jgi:hypothetical protein